MNKKYRLDTTGEGRVQISTDSYLNSWKVSLLLMFRYGFMRWGIYLPSPSDETIYPSYYRGKLKVLKGWDNWSDYYWFADNEKTDFFLTKFYENHCKNISNT